MILKLNAAALALILTGAAASGSCTSGRRAPATPAADSPAAARRTDSLSADLDSVFDSPNLARAVIAARIEPAAGGAPLYSRDADKLVMPASNLKIITMAVAAERLGWDYSYVTTLESRGQIADGTLHGDLVVTGSGDPSIGSGDAGDAPLFLEWADALKRAGVSRVEGRLVGDDTAFDGPRLGAGWAWDYLVDGYAAPVSALNYNENVAVLHIAPGKMPGAPGAVDATPPGHLLEIENAVTTGAAGSTAALDVSRAPGSRHLVVRGSVPTDGRAIVRTVSIDDPTLTFLEALKLALATRGIPVSGGTSTSASADVALPRAVVSKHESEPLSSLVGYAMKVSQNFYGETIFRTIGETPGHPASADAARAAIRDTLTRWGVPADSYVMSDGSGLSRYDYATAATLVLVLTHVWNDERLRGPFVAALPVGGHDGTLASRMTTGPLDREVQAKTGTLTNVRALSGYCETESGDKLAFSFIANNYTVPTAEVDAVMEKALTRVVTGK